MSKLFNQIINKMKLFFKFALVLLAMGVVLQSCKEEFAAPTVTLENTEISAKAGEGIAIIATVTAPAGFSKLTVQKFWGDTEEGAPTEVTTLTDNKYTFNYTVTEDDVEPILKFRFTALDNDGKASAPVEAVVDVELTKAQLLVKYDWLLTDEIRKKTGESDISDVYTDDVYRFNNDGTWDRSIGEKADDFNDLWYNHCYWEVNEETGRLILSLVGAFLEDRRDTLDITTLNSDILKADVIYRGLDIFDPTYDPVEEYEKQMTAQAKGANFDPYHPGPEDDDGLHTGECYDL